MTELKNYYYDLPKNQIAQNPAEKRECSKLMVINKKKGSIEHKNFYNIKDYLHEGDVLVLNDSKVFPARLIGVKEDTSSAAEFLLLENKGGDTWEIIMKPGKKGKNNAVFSFGGGILKAKIQKSYENGNKLAEFYYDKNKSSFFEILEKIGKIPLPPYIDENKLTVNAKERYQTVYANENKKGSAAAPTAGLHFTGELIDSLKNKGVIISMVTLHVGLGTFKPVKTENIEDHKMHGEFYAVSKETADIINKAKKENRKIFAVGTTSCRTLEGNFAKYGRIEACEDITDIFIYGDYKFKITDALITNFHLPESTLLMLVSAFYTRERILEAYKTAIENGYKFFSFGDAMMIF